MNSSIVITVAERTDSDTFSAWLLESKLTLTVNRLLWKNWPNVEAQKPHYAESIEGGWADPAMTYYKATDSTGAVLGFLALSKKQAAPADKAEKVTDCPEVMNEHVFRGVMKAVADICKVTDIEHRYGKYPQSINVVGESFKTDGAFPTSRDHVYIRRPLC